MLAHGSSFVLLVFEQGGDVLVEFFTATKALVNVVSGREVFESSKHGLVKANIGALDVVICLGSSKHRIDLVKPEREMICVFVAEVAKFTRDLSEILRAEEYIGIGIQTKLDVFGHFVHAPALVELSKR